MVGLRGQLHSDSDSDQEETATTNATRGNSGTVLSSLVEFGSNLFRPDFKKASVRSKQRSGVNAASTAAVTTEEQAIAAALEASMEKEYDEACYIIAQCANGIESQPSGPSTLVGKSAMLSYIAAIEAERIRRLSTSWPPELFGDFKTSTFSDYLISDLAICRDPSPRTPALSPRIGLNSLHLPFNLSLRPLWVRIRPICWPLSG
ncbi:unnamed protein product [Schistocephalus solidus]|uniref:BRO1 domain-containing protein n=1 Tax=Schistocephalus solidus TaxID=70667 RepID=A0A183TP13_SCHSO|nr:unnamed protein product [Schistocephalus solidus]